MGQPRKGGGPGHGESVGVGVALGFWRSRSSKRKRFRTIPRSLSPRCIGWVAQHYDGGSSREPGSRIQGDRVCIDGGGGAGGTDGELE